MSVHTWINHGSPAVSASLAYSPATPLCGQAKNGRWSTWSKVTEQAAAEAGIEARSAKL